jgi:serine-type D-Ala-D-Ala carboxypeptidase/endopeptidase
MKVNGNVLIILLTSFIFFQCQTGAEKEKNERLTDEVSRTIKERIAEGITPSIAIALIDSNGIQYFNFGLTSKRGKEVDEHTIYEIGSISKVFTAILLAQQIRDGDLTLDDKINDYLPAEVKVPVMGEQEITFGNLSDHTSGLPRMPYNFTPANLSNPFADYTVDKMYEFITNYQPVREVGEEYEYSNIAQGLLGHLLAANKNTTYENLMIQTIALPLAMNETKIKLDKRMTDNLALGHSDGQVVENWDIPTLAGAGAIRSSTSDMAKFVSANLGYSRSPVMAAMEFSHQIRHDKADAMRVALGWLIKKGEDGDIFCHGGATGGYRTFIGFVKETGRGVVLLTNSSAGADDIGFHLLDPGSKLSEARSKSDAVEIPEATMEQYVGVYELQHDLMITITKEGSQLYGQATGQERFDIYPENDTVFYLTVVEAEISFSMNDGVVENLTLFQDGQELQGKKVE